MKRLAFVIIAALFSGSSFAIVKCEQSRAVSVQVMQDGRVYLRDSVGSRHLLGDAKLPHVTLLAQTAMSALGKDLIVSVAYEDGVSCKEPKDSPVRWIDVQDDKVRRDYE
jgi:hypothetical protein